MKFLASMRVPRIPRLPLRPVLQTPLRALHISSQLSQKNLVLPKFSTVANLATLLRVRFVDLQKKMAELGYSAQDADHIVDDTDAQLIAEEFGITAHINDKHGIDLYPEPALNLDKCPPRPPVIALMGHVDHGKTTLLDYFRSSHVVDGEKGGITQHIGAFSSAVDKTKVCFLDTPGHEAFLKLRQRGANLTDIVLLVVAADDSVMPQTLEAIKHAKAANVPMLVALTKMDRPDSNPSKVIADLANAGVDVEEYGGDTQCIPVSVPRKIGLSDLEGALTALIDVLDVRAPLDGKVEGVVVESQQVKGKGATATVIMKRGTLAPKVTLVAGTSWCKTRQLMVDNKSVKTLKPGIPILISGWKDLPEPGDTILQAASEDEAKKVVANRQRLLEEAKVADRVEEINEIRRIEHEKIKAQKSNEERQKLGLETKGSQDSGPQVLEFVVKADVGGSAEAVEDCINQLGNDEVKAKVLYAAVGPITETDIFRAETAAATIIAFSTQVPKPIERLAEKHKVTIKKHDVIYKALEEITAELSKLLKPDVHRKIVSEAELRQRFRISVKKSHVFVAGVRVMKGTFTGKTLVQVTRNGKVVYEGKLSSIKHGKETPDQAHKGSEYGFSFEGWENFQEGDLVEGYEEVIKPRYL